MKNSTNIYANNQSGQTPWNQYKTPSQFCDIQKNMSSVSSIPSIIPTPTFQFTQESAQEPKLQNKESEEQYDKGKDYMLIPGGTLNKELLQNWSLITQIWS